jgi:hypothetical protein
LLILEHYPSNKQNLLLPDSSDCCPVGSKSFTSYA